MSVSLQRLVRARQNNMEFPLPTAFGGSGSSYTNVPLYSVLGPLPISLGVASTDSSIVVETDALDGVIDGGIRT
jgi:hypothetical protein